MNLKAELKEYYVNMLENNIRMMKHSQHFLMCCGNDKKPQNLKMVAELQSDIEQANDELESYRGYRIE